MSYDVYVGGSSEHFNYTSNVGPMLYDLIPDRGKGGGIRELHETSNPEVVKIIGEFMRNADSERVRLWESGVVGEPKFCEKYDAFNGWGSAVGAILFMARIMAEAAQHPEGVTTVDM